MIHIRYFDGKPYKCFGKKNMTKKIAEAKAKMIRRNGGKARVVKAKKGYMIWIPARQMYRVKKRYMEDMR